MTRRVRIGAVREQRPHHLLVAAHDRLVQRRESSRASVGVRAFVEQELDQLGEPRVRGQRRARSRPRRPRR